MRINDDNIIGVITLGGIILTATLTVAGLFSGQPEFSAGVAAGGVLSLLNFYWLQGTARQLLQMPAARARTVSQVKQLLRLGAVGFILYILIVVCGVSIAGLLAGLSVLVISIMLLALYTLILKGG